MKSRLVSLLLVMGFVLLVQPAKSQDYSKIRIVRLSFVEGTVQYQRPGQDWEDARLNLPIEEGFAIRTADGYAEVEFEGSLTLRLATNATVEFTELALQNGGRITKLTIPQGTAIVSAKLKREDAMSVAAPNLNLNVPRDGRFRVDISPTESWVTVFHGKVQVDSNAGVPSLLSGGHTLHVGATGSGSPEVASNPPQDDFDKWVSHREEAVERGSKRNLCFPRDQFLYRRFRRSLQLRQLVVHTGIWGRLDALRRRNGMDAVCRWAMAVHGRPGMELDGRRAVGLAPLSFWIVGQCSGSGLGMVAGRRHFLDARDGKMGAP